jgi:hypothetical protein
MGLGRGIFHLNRIVDSGGGSFPGLENDMPKKEIILILLESIVCLGGMYYWNVINFISPLPLMTSTPTVTLPLPPPVSGWNIFSDGLCDTMPCWEGLKPGLTDQAEVPALLANLPKDRVAAFRTNEGGASIYLKNTGLVSLSYQDQKVYSMWVVDPDNGTLRVKDILQHWGNPEYVFYDAALNKSEDCFDDHTPEESVDTLYREEVSVEMILLYPSQGASVKFRVPGRWLACIKPSMAVSELTFYPPLTLDEAFRRNRHAAFFYKINALDWKKAINPWRGYGYGYGYGG